MDAVALLMFRIRVIFLVAVEGRNLSVEGIILVLFVIEDVVLLAPAVFAE